MDGALTTENDMLSDRVGEGAHRVRGCRRSPVGVDPHPTEIVAEARFEERPGRCVEGGSGRAQHLGHHGRSRSLALRWGCSAALVEGRAGTGGWNGHRVDAQPADRPPPGGSSSGRVSAAASIRGTGASGPSAPDAPHRRSTGHATVALPVIVTLVALPRE